MDALAEVQRHDTRGHSLGPRSRARSRTHTARPCSQEPWSLSLAALACMSVQVGRQIKPLSQRPCTRSLSCQYIFPYHLQTLSYILMPCHCEYQHPGRTLNIKRQNNNKKQVLVKWWNPESSSHLECPVGPTDLSVSSCFNYLFLSSPDIYR